MNICFPLLLPEADLWFRIDMPLERHEVQSYMESFAQFSSQDDGLVESPFPQPLGMKGGRYDQRVFSDIEGWVCKFCHQFFENFADMNSPVIFKPMDRFEDGGFGAPNRTGSRID